MARSWASCRLVSVIWKRAAVSARPVNAARCAAALICSVWVIGVCDMVGVLLGRDAAAGVGGGGLLSSGAVTAPPARRRASGTEHAGGRRHRAAGHPVAGRGVCPDAGVDQNRPPPSD